AIANGWKGNWTSYDPPKPSLLGIHPVSPTINDLIPFIDWTPFFSSWQLAGKYPDILSDAIVGEQARALHADVLHLLDSWVKNKTIKPKGVWGIFPVNRQADDTVEVMEYNGKHHLATFYFLRQQRKKAAGLPNLSLVDFLSPASSGTQDYLGCFAVTAGEGLEEVVRHFEQDHDDYHAILAKSLADRLAEAFAEWLHWRIRTEYWGYAHQESLNNEQLIAEKYQGIRPAPGYPACPDHTEKQTLFQLLQVEQHTPITLTDSMAMYPASSVCGYYFSHPDSKYFGLGLIDKDQMTKYARLKGIPISTMERWLSAALAYEPDVLINQED
ncbi:MAG TPA: vitamin B12 dependent-methionine synthase activation domain-containing protein, partial [Saprospiraceae bacterium]|nr:vitamin B12 dependent-methionine synthase activation domain-containing protein [Saprospiraceae bacterium]